MGKAFGMPVFHANGYVVPAARVKYFRMSKDKISIYLDDEMPLTSCKPEQLGFGFFPDEPEMQEKGNLIKTLK